MNERTREQLTFDAACGAARRVAAQAHDAAAELEHLEELGLLEPRVWCNRCKLSPCGCERAPAGYARP